MQGLEVLEQRKVSWEEERILELRKPEWEALAFRG